MRRWTTLAAGLVISLAAVVACDSETIDSSDTAAPEEDAPAARSIGTEFAEATALQLGDHITLRADAWVPGPSSARPASPEGDDVSVTFITVEVLASLPDEVYGGGSIAPLGRWLVVHYSLTNHLTEPIVVTADFHGRFVLFDETGRRWKPNVTHEASAALSRGYVPAPLEIPPGGTARTVALFDAPLRSAGLQIFAEELGFTLDLGLDR